MLNTTEATISSVLAHGDERRPVVRAAAVTASPQHLLLCLRQRLSSRGAIAGTIAFDRAISALPFGCGSGTVTHRLAGSKFSTAGSRSTKGTFWLSTTARIFAVT